MELENKNNIIRLDGNSSIKEQEILKAAKKLKSVFLDNMSHELRTPITVILGYAGILYEELQDPDLKDMAEIILKSSNRLTDSLNLLLDQSDIDSNRLKVEFEKINLNEIVNHTYNIYKPIAEAKGIEIHFDSQLEGAYSFIDEKMFSKVINNLVNNAIKFTEEGGVNISVSRENKNKVNNLLIKISDSGIGIPNEKQKLIFEAFRQVSEGMNRLYQGTGLGLSVTKKFIELMNGTISVTSKVNEGTTFSIRFPAVI